MKSPRLSIIVPIYRVEQYLRKCVDSLLDQGLKEEEYEIILVDDGSPDGCPAIADEYAAKFRNVSVIHKENGGLSSARNAGLKQAKGERVLFVDSDDWLEPRSLGKLIATAEGLDVLRINYQNVDEDGKVFQPNKEYKPFVDYSPEVCDGPTFLNERLGFGCYAVMFIMRRSLLMEGEPCLFKEGIYFEDTEWTPRMLVRAKTVASSDLMVYNYLSRRGSITRAVEKSKQEKVLRDRFTLIESLQKQAASVQDPRWFKGMTAATVVAMASDLATIFWPERRACLKRLRQLRIFPLSLWHANKSATRKIKLLNISPELTLLLLHLAA